jgi:hypothetical protein
MHFLIFSVVRDIVLNQIENCTKSGGTKNNKTLIWQKYWNSAKYKKNVRENRMDNPNASATLGTQNTIQQTKQEHNKTKQRKSK